MISQIENELCYIKHCLGVYEQIGIVNSVPVDDWTAELAITTSHYITTNEIDLSVKEKTARQ